MNVPGCYCQLTFPLDGSMKDSTMTTVHSQQSGELLAPLDVRRNALKMLRSQGYRALDDVKIMLGLGETVSYMTNKQVAPQLGITEGQLKYMLFRDERRREAKKRCIAAKEAKKIDCTSYISNKLKFTISLPKNWQVITDTLKLYNSEQEVLEIIGYAESAEETYQQLLLSERAKSIAFHAFEKVYNRNKQQAYRLFFGNLLGMPLDEEIVGLARREFSATEAYRRLMEDPQTFLVEFQDFKYNYEESLQKKRTSAENDMRLQRMMIGLFQGFPPDNENEDEVNVEVTKLRLTGSLTALDLYELDKQPSEAVPWGNRPSKGIVVDGLRGVLYYYLFDTGDPRSDLPVFFNVYLAEQNEGWIISCSCKYGDFCFKTFKKNKPVFKRIVSSFRRI